ncbi:MAG: HAD family phosphatase [Bacteroidales bacterium]
MIQAIIFDMDGVLVDSEPLHYEADSEVFRELGIQVSKEDRDTFLGKGPEGVLAFLKNKYRLTQSLEELINLDNQVRFRYFQNHTPPPMPGLRSLLDELHQEGIPMAVATSSVRLLVEYLLGNLGLSGYFQHIVCGDDVPKTKPDPALFLLAAAKLGMLPSSCLVIEDSPNGFLAARAAGMKCAIYNRFNKQDLASLKADYSFAGFTGLQAASLINL